MLVVLELIALSTSNRDCRSGGRSTPMNRPDQEAFDRDVRFIRRNYGGRDKWESPASIYVRLFWYSREPVGGKCSPDREISLDGLIGLSKVDRYVWDAVNLISQQHLSTGGVLPDPLAQWVADLLADQTIQEREDKLRPRPTKGRELRIRDSMMCLAVARLVARGYRATRREGKAQASAEGGTACDVVGKAFFKSYKNVERVWFARTR